MRLKKILAMTITITMMVSLMFTGTAALGTVSELDFDSSSSDATGEGWR